MSTDREIHLVVFGLSGHELRVLRTISIISRNRSRMRIPRELDHSFRLIVTAHSGRR